MSLGLRTKVGVVAWLCSMAACGEDPALGAPSGDDGSTDSSTGEPASVDVQIEAFVAMRCERASECDCAGTIGSGDCNAAETAVWEARLAAGDARELTRDDTCIAANLATLETAGCAWASAALQDGEHLCSQYCALYHGERGMGETCEAYDALVSDCAQGLLCDAGICVDPCTRLTGLALGQTCASEASGAFDDCARGAYCEYRTRVCTTAALAGESCDDRECGEGLHCDWNTGTCRSAAEGASCSNTGVCDDGLYCDYDVSPPICRARSVAGQSCTSTYCVDGLVCEDGVCREPPPAGERCLSGRCAEGAECDWSVEVCRALPVVGEACPSGACASGSWCDVGSVPEPVCASPAMNGEACTGHAQCESGYCPRGYCEARPTDGEDCSSLFICARGLVCNGSTCQPTAARGPVACVYPGW